ncbi:hypothetical protein K443DRAFT_303445 [Laccaria amethystina LaAM-08-1]|uniref:Uncharacterized protein n=1 Tax=Laccaria amethystina LaAM-08-1 TaxID=1095629 RepID=A0A0C9XCA0_9AGAR|nr:hypothetical protein K443DRAFT_303445 [Laccaria amethystina LaAM-08-1]
MRITQPILIGVVSGVAAANCIFAVAWCIFKGRRNRAKRQRQLLQLAGRPSALKQPSSKAPPNVGEIQTSDRYMQGMHTINQYKRTTINRARKSHAILSQETSQFTHPTVPPGLPLASGSIVDPSNMCGASTFSDNASVYSSASAPPEFHEALSDTQILGFNLKFDTSDVGHLGSTRAWSDRASRAPHIREGLISEASVYRTASNTPSTEQHFMSQARVEMPTRSIPQRSEPPRRMISADQQSPNCLNPIFSPPHLVTEFDSHRRLASDQQLRVLNSSPPLPSPHSPPQYAAVSPSQPSRPPASLCFP